MQHGRRLYKHNEDNFSIKVWFKFEIESIDMYDKH